MTEHLNLWQSRDRVPNTVSATPLTLSGEFIDKDPLARWKTMTRLTTLFPTKGVDATHVPQGLRHSLGADVLFLSTSPMDTSKLESQLPRVSNITMKIGSPLQLRYADSPAVFDGAWRNAFRALMRRLNFLTSGASYVPPEQVSSTNPVKKSFRISTEVIGGKPSLWIDPGSKVMNPLPVVEARTATPERSVTVRVLPDWHKAFLVGTYPEEVKDYKELDLVEHWRFRGVDIQGSEAVYRVKFTEESSSYAYPQSCVFKEYEPGKKDQRLPKLPPSLRIQLAQDLLRRLGFPMFLGQTVSFDSVPLEARNYLASSSQFESGNDFIVTLKKLGKPMAVPVLGIKDALLGGAEPYTGKISGKYHVVAPVSVTDQIGPALRQIEQDYRNLNMGTISPAAPPIFIQGRFQSEYMEAFGRTIQDILRETVSGRHQPTIVFVVLTNMGWKNNLFFEAKNTFFNPSAVLDEFPPIQIQCLEEATIAKLPGNAPISYNIAPQVYLKLFGRHSAVWLCDTPADSNVYPDSPGITAYACYDVSRRRKLKSQVSVFTAVTDGYGRFIAYDRFSTGGENLTPLAFEKLVESISRTCRQYADTFAIKEPNLKFNLRRIVLYKDGLIDRREASIMEEVFSKGIPEEGIQSLPDYFKGRSDLPQSLAIDIVGVNKSSIKRLFVRNGNDWSNPRRGLCAVGRGGRTAYLVGSQAQRSQSVEISTVQPLEIEHIHHFNINSDLPSPGVEALSREYYHLTFLDWVTFYQRSKFALPQRITQRTGEYLSYNVNVPKGVTLL